MKESITVEFDSDDSWYDKVALHSRYHHMSALLEIDGWCRRLYKDGGRGMTAEAVAEAVRDMIPASVNEVE